MSRQAHLSLADTMCHVIIPGMVVATVSMGVIFALYRLQSIPLALDVPDVTEDSPEVSLVAVDDVADIMQVNEDGLTTLNPAALDTILETNNSAGVASDDEQEGAIFMLEEEKLAYDVYRTLYDRWGMRIFDNISQSEATHIEAVRTLAERYAIPISFYDETVGIFHNETLRTLYQDLTARGSKSLDEALRVGALIEELDIVDLQRYIEATNNQDFIAVYENLQRGSRNHLRAFVRNIEGAYLPVYLAQEEFDAIIGSETERGQGGHGRRGR